MAGTANWETTFYFQQELKSSYMNNLINGLIRPGIYNMDATIYTEPAIDGKTAGVYLRINAGAILVFSNNYVVENGVRVRDTSKVGSYLVKCVLTREADIPLSMVSNQANVKTTGYLTSSKRIPAVFVTAAFTYNPEDISSTTPEFALTLPRGYGSVDPDYLTAVPQSLPNEDLSAGNINTSYLILGALLDRSVPFAGTNEGTPYATANDWASEILRKEWVRNHVFTGRGFPEYKESILRNYGESVPSIGFSPYYKNMYMTSGQFYHNGVLYSIDGLSWKDIYGQGGNPTHNESPTGFSGFTTDGQYASIEDSLSGIYTVDNAINFTENQGKLVVDFLFMALRSNYSSGGEGKDKWPDDPGNITLSNLFSPQTDITKKLIPFRVICDDPNIVGFDTLTTSSSDPLQEAFNLNGKALVPLDISISNIKRLKKMLYNKDVILKVIDSIRQYADTRTPYFVAGTGDSLLPIMISFRKIKESTEANPQDFNDASSGKNAVRLNNFSLGESAVNPANVLSFFELQSSGFTIQGAPLASQGTFTMLPFLGD